MNTEVQARAVLPHLRGLKEALLRGDDSFAERGICHWVWEGLQRSPDGDPYMGACYGLKEALYCAFKAWPEFSGDKVYPVPGPGDTRPDVAYHTCKDKFNPETEYGAARLRLLDFLIQYFEEKIRDDHN